MTKRRISSGDQDASDKPRGKPYPPLQKDHPTTDEEYARAVDLAHRGQRLDEALRRFKAGEFDDPIDALAAIEAEERAKETARPDQDDTATGEE